MEFTAKYKYADMSPRKVRLVADLIRGKHVNDALQVLRATNKRASFLIDRTLRSAIANADESMEAVWIDPGPIRKKWWPRARGRATPIRGRTSHINIVLDDGKEK
jgi:large subunit ribosomal protein L22